ncbi:Ser/Thr protein kinase RdoA involved in Cpx stress response, MazF antagonist [Nannocystis exedens]|uniref:Ser/Thr protein kinase RdoA involved in Cpx stress response, MazF antagonist n=1 Tax=Nannocystis exedens TaxID=54 RepID=A0A1I2HZ68_9BACT|nr:aminoglycoside phosphotransferase family protein [Nannocystis exedens]PCC72027.1 N-acetylhexosamine 1-kinase [Nannocystis exedens]SFF33926.1 Ser/Thr protein kinase RdoA involved in Cpx stress response, MazF antagonist [Nannocystis exedens]
MTRPPPDAAAIARALAQFPELADGAASPLTGGLINATFAVRAPAGEFVLQRLHPIFAPQIHDNIAAVTEHLRRRGETSPRLLTTTTGARWADLGALGIWRAMTRVPGVSFEAVRSPAQARSAGALVGRFHATLADLDHPFTVRRTLHDTPAHLRTLAEAVAQHRGHRLFAEVEPLAKAVFAAAETLPPLAPAPLRVGHGDLKFNNLLFDETGPEGQGAARCLIDLDSVAPMPLHHELGDAWRSWCNPAGEERGTSSFDAEIFAAALAGWLEALTFPLEPVERRNLVHGVEWIALELTARFAADALHERYFGWDPQRFPAAGEHHLHRAKGQWALHQATLATRELRAQLLLR